MLGLTPIRDDRLIGPRVLYSVPFGITASTARPTNAPLTRHSSALSSGREPLPFEPVAGLPFQHGIARRLRRTALRPLQKVAASPPRAHARGSHGGDA
jgi:hypothetical protein